MSHRPSAAWYLAPIFLGVIGSAIMWYVLKDEDHPDSPKMVRKGWIIGIALTVISFAWIPIMLIIFALTDFDDQQMMPPHMEQSGCDPSYPTVCIPLWPPDLDCGEIRYVNFTVLPPDPHGFDGDKDGIGC